MATLNQYRVNNTNGRLFFSIVQNPVVEPIDGPLFIEHLMLRFPEEIYSKSRDSHIYRLLTALAGDSGAGILKKKSLMARLQYESAMLGFQNLDNLYSPLIGFDRLPNERYLIDPKKSALTQEEWDAIKAADTAYRKRALQYLQAARQGGTLQGITDAATAALGQNVQVTENYKYIFDQNSDRIAGFKNYGMTNSVSEFIIRPRVSSSASVSANFASLRLFDYAEFYLSYNGEDTDLLYSDILSADTLRSVIEGFEQVEQGDVVVTQTTTTTYSIEFSNSNLDIKRLSLVPGAGFLDVAILTQSSANDLFYIGDVGDPSTEYYNAHLSVSETSGIDKRSSSRDYINPYIQKNLDVLINKLKPESSLFSIVPSEEKYIEVPVNSVFSSSERFYVNRFVTANPNVVYPDVDKLNGKILEPGVENEERNYAFVGVDMPVVFMTVDTVISYTNDAGLSPKYNTEVFYNGDNAEYKVYESRHSGVYPEPTSLIYPFFKAANENLIYSADQILPERDTTAVFKGAITS
jgi:hypothetical protein